MYIAQYIYSKSYSNNCCLFSFKLWVFVKENWKCCQKENGRFPVGFFLKKICCSFALDFETETLHAFQQTCLQSIWVLYQLLMCLMSSLYVHVVCIILWNVNVSLPCFTASFGQWQTNVWNWLCPACELVTVVWVIWYNNKLFI